MGIVRGICLITENVTDVSAFYAALLDAKAEGDDRHASLEVGGMHVTFAHTSVMEDMAPGSLQGAGCGSFTIDIEVTDVDAMFRRMGEGAASVVKPPQTYPWGTRSLWVRDPDGNIVNLFQRI